MTTRPIKIGILGCANIARKVSRAIILSPNATLHAIGSRSYEKAAQFAKENGFPDSAKVYGSYDAVLEDPEVDAVYLPLPTSLHVEWAIRAARNNKHVLLEKPVALNVEELDKILGACESSGVQFMDGTMWMHHPRTVEMKEFLSDSSLFGEIRTVHSNLTFAANKDFLENDIRVNPNLDALGALGDVGWYCIRSILWATNFELPKSALALPGTILNNAGVILSCSASLNWENGTIATFHCSFLANVTMDVIIVGTNGTLRFHDFAIPCDEKEAIFFTGTNSGFDELVTGWEEKPSERIVKTEIPQEAVMILFGGDIPAKFRSESSKLPMTIRRILKFKMMMMMMYMIQPTLNMIVMALMSQWSPVGMIRDLNLIIATMMIKDCAVRHQLLVNIIFHLWLNTSIMISM